MIFTVYKGLYSLRSELLVASMDVSRCILVLDTFIFATSNLERREYIFSEGGGGGGGGCHPAGALYRPDLLIFTGRWTSVLP